MSHIPSTTHYVDLSSLVTAPLPLAQLASVSRTIEGWDTTMDFTPGNNRIDFTLTATRGQNPEATLSATGYIQNFIAEASFDVASGTMQNASFDASHLNGAVDFTWQASTDIGIGDHTLIHIPIKVEVPVIVGGIPFQIGIGAAFNAGFGFSSKNSTSGGGSKVTFGGDEGFKVDNSGQLTAQGAMQGIGPDLERDPDGHHRARWVRHRDRATATRAGYWRVRHDRDGLCGRCLQPGRVRRRRVGRPMPRDHPRRDRQCWG